LILDILIL